MPNRRICLFAILMLAASSASAGNNDVHTAALRAIVTDTTHAVVPGCAVGVFQDGGNLVTAAGMADIQAMRPIDGNTIFYAASVSKQFTALAIAQLVVQRRINLDDDVRRYIPQLPTYAAPITIGMLLHHTSGIRDWIGLMQLSGHDAAAEDGKDVALKLLFAQKTTNFVPGTQFIYSNGAYLILAEIVEKVSGLPFFEYEQKHILDPMGMTGSYFLHGDDVRGDARAHGYVPRGGGFAVRDTYPRFGGSGGLMVSMNDLARYYHDIRIGHKVWTPEVAKIMLTPGKFTNGEAVTYRPGGIMGYASGLAIGERRGQFIVQHGGAATGFKNELGWFPQANLGVAVLCNHGDWDPLDKFDAVVQQVRPGLLAGITAESLSGVYRSDELSADYVIEPNGDSLRLTIVPAAGIAPTTMLMHKAAGRGYERSFEGLGMRLTPDADGKGVVIGTSRARDIHLARVSTRQ